MKKECNVLNENCLQVVISWGVCRTLGALCVQVLFECGGAKIGCWTVRAGPEAALSLCPLWQGQWTRWNYPWPESSLWAVTWIKRLDFIQAFIGLAALKPAQKLPYRKGFASVEFDLLLSGNSKSRASSLLLFSWNILCVWPKTTKNRV